MTAHNEALTPATLRALCNSMKQLAAPFLAAGRPNPFYRWGQKISAHAAAWEEQNEAQAKRIEALEEAIAFMVNALAGGKEPQTRQLSPEESKYRHNPEEGSPTWRGGT